MSEIQNNNNKTGLELAVIGMSGRFPGAGNINEFWENLKNGVEFLFYFNQEELIESGVNQDLVREPNYVKSKGVLEDIEYFDYAFFDYTRREAEWMDPQLRILHECAWHALEDAGYDPDSYNGAIGLFTGTLANYQWVNSLFNFISNQSEQTVIGSLNDRDFFSTRAAYKLNLRGPALTVQTACSTSLVAIHMGCQSLLSGESDMVLAGGISIWLPKKGGYLYEPGMIRSSDGRCRAFDVKANGTNGGDAAAIVVLKRLADALADGDQIAAVIKGSAINNDGKRKVGYTAPSVEGQVEVIRAAMQMAEVDSESITMIEAHGTATALGDPVEIEALKKAFASDKRQFCAIGSVKTNVGHLDAAAGAAGFIKAVLALKHHLIPPSLHFEIPNPRIDFENSPFYVNTKALEWKTGNQGSPPLRAGVSSFGLGGTNAHVILEEPPGTPLTLELLSKEPDKKEKYCFYHLIPLSAKTRTALERLTQNLGEHFNTYPGLNLADAAYTLQLGRKPFKFRRTLVCRDIDEALTTLKQDSHEAVGESLENPRAVFMFSGQGAQYVNMGLDLYRLVPFFAEETDRCLHILEGLMTADLKEVLYPPPSESSRPSQAGDMEPVEGSTAEIHQFVYASPIKFVFDYSLARLLMKWGIQPYAMIGHSFGEYVAACLSGVLSLEDALKLVVERGRLMQQMPDGAMMNVPLSESQLQPYLNDELSLAAVNEPRLCIVSGTLTAVKALEEQLTEKGLECMRLRVPKAGHSTMVEPILDEFKKTLDRVTFHKPGIPYTSGLSGKWITVEQAADPLYWLDHMRRTNRFSDGLVELFKEANTVFIEVGSGRGLSLFVNRHPGKGPGHRTLNLVKHHKETISDVSFLLDKIGWLWSMGINIDWQAFNGDEKLCRISLPLYPFDRHYFSVDISGCFQQQGDRQEPLQDTVIQAEVADEERGRSPATLIDPVEEKTTAILKDVLGLDRVGLDKDFFELGGDSLTAIMASSNICKLFGVEFPVKVILGGSTVKEIAVKIRELDKHTYSGIPPAEKREYYPLSSAQKRLFFLDRFGDISTTYHMPYVLKITGHLDKKQLKNSFQGLIYKHETLRTSFILVEDEPVQRVHEIDSLDLEIEGYVNRSSPVIHDFVRPFNLSQAPLIRVGLVETGANEYLLVLDMHHIITDGTSMGVLVNEFARFYEDRESPSLKIQYKDFSQWQNHLYQTGGIKKQEEFWLNLFPDSSAVPVLGLPLDFPRPDVFTYEGDSYGFTLEAEETQRFKEMAAACDATLFMNLLAAFNVLLSRYSGQGDIMVGSAVAGRSHADLQDLIGMFVNMLAMRNQPVEGLTYLEFLETVRSNCLDAFANRDLQFEDLVDKLELERDTTRNPLFSVSFLLQNFEQPEIKIKDTVITRYEYWNKVSRFDMSVLSYEREGGIYFRIMYYRRIFKRETIEQMARHFINIIKIAGEQPGIEIGEIDFLSAGEKQQLLYDFNHIGEGDDPDTDIDIKRDYPGDGTIVGIFEEQVEQVPDRAAVVSGNHTLTYRQLNERSNRLANYLPGETGVFPDQPVALLLDPSVDMVVAIFGVLKAGGAYAPIDPGLPEERLKGMLVDMGVRVVISGKKYIRVVRRMQWECPLLYYFLCLDSRDIYWEEEVQKSQLMDEALWEYVGETAADDIAGGGWNTSYTGEPFSSEEMNEYGDNALKKLDHLLGKDVRVLEIGCASGITMFRIAPRVGFYYGTDLSRAITARNRERVQREGHQNIALAAVPAHEIHTIGEKNFDIIIMNSVVQNFHGHNYFRRVIRSCIDLLGEKGTLFIGDVMDQALKEELVREMTAFKRANRGKGYRTTTDFSQALFLSREYLRDLAKDLPEVVNVEFSSKIYTIENELTRFRYDVCISINKTGLALEKDSSRHRYQHDLKILDTYPGVRLLPGPVPGHLAYVIFTSGSTGQPRGVMVEHGNVVHLVKGLYQCIYRKYTGKNETLRVGMISPYMFDASVKQIFGALLLGHTLYIASEETRIDGELLLAFYRANCIRVSDGTPAHLRLLSEEVGGRGRQSGELDIRSFIIGGEALSGDLAEDILNYFHHRKVSGKPVKSLTINNVYGPTECTVDATSFELSGENINQHNTITVPIGIPLPSVYIYITGLGGVHHRLQPFGAAGQICIRGKGVARGYLNNPELTTKKFRLQCLINQKFLPGGPGGAVFSKRVPPGRRRQIRYLTGDMGRWLSGGNIEFLGRMDHQVKIRGFRVELEGIAHLLGGHPGVKQAVVTLKKLREESYICAYFVAASRGVSIGGNTGIEEELKEYLSAFLPAYMIPSYFIQIEKVPLTQTGKINPGALPVPGFLVGRREGYTAPGEIVEETLASIWSEVLGIDKAVIGIDDDFFELGGHSLRALIVISRIQKVLRVKIPLAEIFKSPYIRSLTRYIKKSEQEIYENIRPMEKREYYPLSSAQRRVFFLNQMEDIGLSYNLPDSYLLEGEIDKQRMENTFRALILYHETLRTSFHMLGSEIVQRVHDEVGFRIEYYDAGAGDFKNNGSGSLYRNFIRPFDLSRAPLFRVGLISFSSFSDGRYQLLFDIHHIISDGTSLENMARDFMQLYRLGESVSESGDIVKKLVPLRVQYRDFVRWQECLGRAGGIKEQEDYWLSVFPGSGAIPILNFPADFPRPDVFRHQGSRCFFSLDTQVAAGLMELGLRTGTTLYMQLSAALNILLYKYTGQEDIVIGIGTACRRHVDLHPLIGMFVNSLPLRSQFRAADSCRQFLAEVKKNGIKAFENQDVRLEDLVDKIKPPRDTSRNPLFNVALVVQNFQRYQRQMAGVTVTSRPLEFNAAKFDWTLFVQESGDDIRFIMEYCTALYTIDTIQRLTNHLFKVLDSLVADIEITIGEVDILTVEEKHQLLEDFNCITAPYSGDKTLHRLFEEQAEQFPDRIILVGPKHCRTNYAENTAPPGNIDDFGEVHLSSGELNRESGQLTCLLKENGVRPGTIAAVMFTRSIEMIVGLLGILKAGGAYLPIDTQCPQERIDYMLGDSAAGVLLVSRDLTGDMRLGKEIISIKQMRQLSDEISMVPLSVPAPALSTAQAAGGGPRVMAYVIYTSGSTGKPKGVPITHDNVCCLLHWGYECLDLGGDDRVIQNLPYYFDWSVWEIFITLTSGARLVIEPQQVLLNPADCMDVILRKGITVLHITPSQYRVMVDTAIGSGRQLKSLRYLNIGAEALDYSLLKRSAALLSNVCRIFNMYGPTETTILTTAMEIIEITGSGDYNYRHLAGVPIGKAIANARLLVLDRDFNLCPINVTGELVIAGSGLALGYLNSPGLTAERFHYRQKYLHLLPKSYFPFYRTGDLVRWLADGNIEFLGRKDFQVKIRGNRIELGEIETRLMRHEDINQAVVAVKEGKNRDKYLCGYYTSGKELSSPELKAHLAGQLPDYMIPSYFMRLDKFPSNPNRKIHRKALPDPVITPIEYLTLPTGHIQAKLVEIWSEILDVSRIGIDDNFFALGGHSLKAALLAAGISKAFQVEFPLNNVFAGPTIRRMSELIKTCKQISYGMIKVGSKKEYYPMSASQKRLFFLDRFGEADTVYNIPCIIKIDGKIDGNQLESAVYALIARHEALRTSFHAIADQPVQRVHENVDIEIEYFDLTASKPGRVIEDDKSAIIHSFIRPFDLETAPLLRVGYISLTAEQSLLLFDIHHIIGDGISLVNMQQDFTGLYAGKELPPLRIHYKDFSCWQNKLAESGKINDQEDYWLNLYRGEIPRLNLPTDFSRPDMFSFAGDKYDFKPGKWANDIPGVTLFMKMLTYLVILLHKYTGQEDIIVGTFSAGRNHVGLQPVIGMFVNSLALRLYPEGEKTFPVLMDEVKKKSIEAFENQDVQFEYLVEKLNPQRDPARNPFFDVCLNVGNFGMAEQQITTHTFTPVSFNNRVSKFDFTLFAFELGDEILFSMEYCTALFKRETIRQMAGHFLNIINYVDKNPGTSISGIDMLSEEEKHRLVYDFNQSSLDYVQEKTITQLFEEQVEKRPDYTLVIFEDKHLTYKELNEQANRLAGILNRKSTRQEKIIGIMVEPSCEMITGMLGIIKAGKAFLPIDHGCPRARASYMLEDSGARLLLSQQGLTRGIPGEMNCEVINFEDMDLDKGDSQNPIPGYFLDDLMYIIYTSGSTGKPKGVMVEHGSVVNLCMWHRWKFPVTMRDRVMKHASFSFDASIWEVYPCLVLGISLYIVNDEIKPDIDMLNKYIEEKNITIVFLSTQICEQFMYLQTPCSSIRLVLTGGDALRKFPKKEHLFQLYNNYGPTESTVIATNTCLSADADIIHIGKPIANTRIYILSKHSQIQPVGIAGELCIAGACLARGYLNRPELTAEKFNHQFFQKELPGGGRQKIYKTGDLARWLADGNIEFMGRIDTQVKIRGFRVELGEIESQLLKQRVVKEAVVIAGQDSEGDKYITAYLVTSPTKETKSWETTAAELKECLSRQLPNYMIPANFVQIERIPLTLHGKVDLAALPEPGFKTGIQEPGYIKPADRIEEKLVEIWSEVLGLEKEAIGMDTDFFEIGGHSLRATIVMTKIHQAFNSKIPLPVLFKTPRINALAEYIRKTETETFTSILAIEEKEYYPLSSAQKRMFILNRLKGDDISDNGSGVLLIEGELDIDRFENTIHSLVKRHEAFRTSFEILDGEAVQRVHRELDFKIKYIEAPPGLNAGEIEAIIQGFIIPFDLGKPSLLRVGLVKLEENRHLLLFDIHHIISDGVSMNILRREFIDIYYEEDVLPLPIQYKDFTLWQNNRSQSAVVKKQDDYWLEVFSGELPELEMPTDFPRPAVQSFEGDYIEFEWDEDLTGKINEICREYNASLFMVLLTIYNILLYKYTGQEDIVVGSPIAGRPHIFLENIIGFFVNTLALRNYPVGEKTFVQFFNEVKTNALNAYENQDYQFEELVERLGIQPDSSRSVLFDTMFAVQNTEVYQFRERYIFKSNIKDLVFKPFKYKEKITQFDIIIHAYENDGCIAFKLRYCTKLFAKETIEKLNQYFEAIAASVLDNPMIRLKDIKISLGLVDKKIDMPEISLDF